jgi:hypothetical protein
MAPAAMGGDFEATMKATFALKVKRVRSNGTAEGVLTIRSFKVIDGKGRVMAGLKGLPPGALKNSVDIDAKGRFKFKEVIYLLVDQKNQTTLLVSGRAGPNGASASAESDGQRLSVYAEFDPKTGRLRGGATIEKVAKAKPKKKKVAVRKDAKKIEILPVKFLQMLQLPEGPVRPGASVEARIANYTTRITVDDITNGIATIRTDISTAGDKPAPESGASVKSNEGGMGMGMAMGMGMPGMGGPPGGAPSGGAGMGGMPMMKMNGTIKMGFNVDRGQFGSIDGDMSVSTSMGGMGKMKSNTTFKIRRAN